MKAKNVSRNHFQISYILHLITYLLQKA